MSLKIKTATRLRALFPGVSLSKKSVEALGDQFAKAGLTDESTDDEIDAKLNERNALYSFEDQKKFDDYQTGKAAKEKADKEAADKKAAEEGKTTTPPADETATEKTLRLIMEKLEKQEQVIASFGQEKVATTRREKFIQSMEGTSKEYQARELKKFDRIAFKDDDDFTLFLEDIKEDHAAAIQEDANEGLGDDKPAGSTGGGSAKKGASEAELDAVFGNVRI